MLGFKNLLRSFGKVCHLQGLGHSKKRIGSVGGFWLEGAVRARCSRFLSGSSQAGQRKQVRSSSMSEELRLSQRLWEACHKQAMLALYNPFVVALASGKLEKTRFQRFIEQDVFFLTAFSKAYGLAHGNTQDSEAKCSIRSLQHDVDEELKTHSSYLEELGFSARSSQIVPNAATSAYTDFLLATAAGEALAAPEGSGELFEANSVTTEKKRKHAAFAIAAMTPCMRLYAFLGTSLRNSTGAEEENMYQSWIDIYSGDAFQSSAFQIELLLDRLASDFMDKEVKFIETLYQRAMDLEVAFFNAQHASSGLLRTPLFKAASAADDRYFVVSDFDSTCTKADSCPVLAELTISAAPVAEMEGGSMFSLSSKDLRGRWNALVELYAKEFEEVLEKVLSTRQDLEEKYDYDAIRSALKTISEFEVKANARVVDSGVLRGIRQETINYAGRCMPLRPGCKEFLQRAKQETRLSLSILSVCWSQSFVEGALCEGIPSANIYANELQFTEGVSNGNITRHVQNAMDKERILNQIVLVDNHLLSTKQAVVYLGDGLTDLLCLLQADVGIILGDNLNLQRFADAFEVAILPLFCASLALEKGKDMGDRKAIYKAADWHEVQAFLLGG